MSGVKANAWREGGSLVAGRARDGLAGRPGLRGSMCEAELQIHEEPAKAIGPRGSENRVVLPPEDPGGRSDWRGHRGRAFDDGHPTLLVAHVPVEAALEVAGLQEVVDPALELRVKGIFPVRPVPQDVVEIDAAASRDDPTSSAAQGC